MRHSFSVGKKFYRNFNPFNKLHQRTTTRLCWISFNSTKLCSTKSAQNVHGTFSSKEASPTNPREYNTASGKNQREGKFANRDKVPDYKQGLTADCVVRS
jgi:hypothetical protein